MDKERFCSVCITGSEVCYIKKAEEINKAANELPDPSNELSEKERDMYGKEMGLAANNMIVEIRDRARDNYCKNTNNIVSDNKWNEYL